MAVTLTVTTLIDEFDTDATPDNPGGAGFSLTEAVLFASGKADVTINFAPHLSGGTIGWRHLCPMVSGAG